MTNKYTAFMFKLIRNWYRRISGGPDVTVEISEKGVLRVNATRLLNTAPAKRQIEATQRLQRNHSTSRLKHLPEYKALRCDYDRRSKYGITLHEYNEKLKAQPECAICGVKFSADVLPQLDHSHKSGKIRAFLCSNCNWGIGNFRDNIKVLVSAICYLTAHK